MKEKEEKYQNVDKSDLSSPILVVNSSKISIGSNQEADKKEKKKQGCQFPTAYTILLVIESIVFILTYIIPKDQYHKIEYDSDKDIFQIKTQNEIS